MGALPRALPGRRRRGPLRQRLDPLRPEEIEAALLGIPELQRVAVLSWPFALRQPGPRRAQQPVLHPLPADGVDERHAPPLCPARPAGSSTATSMSWSRPPTARPSSTSCRAPAAASSSCAAATWRRCPAPRAPVTGRTHRHFPYMLADPAARLSRQKKWALEPIRPWVADARRSPLHALDPRPPLVRQILARGRLLPPFPRHQHRLEG